MSHYHTDAILFPRLSSTLNADSYNKIEATPEESFARSPEAFRIIPENRRVPPGAAPGLIH